MDLEAEPLRGLGCVQHLLDRPLLALGGLPVNLLRGEGVEGVVIDGVHRDQLADQMRRQFGDREAVTFRDPGYLVAIGL